AVVSSKLKPTPPATSKRMVVPLRPMLPVIAPECCGLPCAVVTEPRRAGNAQFARGPNQDDLKVNAGYNACRNAGVAQLVERNVANVEVASSRLVSRSKNATPRNSWPERAPGSRGAGGRFMHGSVT